tara:strand:+ start:164 stop:544 length:381 start_codon:yes stop_codon:yes gene_type:complete
MDQFSELFDKFGNELEDCYEIKYPIGWNTLVSTLLEYVAWHNTVHNTNVKIHSISKKRGGLHFVIIHRPEISSIAEEIFGAIHLAETLSCRTCETCGKPAAFVKSMLDDELVMGSYCDEHLPKERD